MKCLKECIKTKSPCKRKDCDSWMNYKEEYNCIHEAIDRNGSMTLREVALRLGISFVRVKQIEDKAIKKLGKKGI
tara:strand:- start:202 stop:426 length:225 start_codon:yes stop_codon:yes gene_type:complete